MAYGIRITANGENIGQATPSQFAVDSEHPLWLCDIVKKPMQYGVLKATINSVPAFTTRSLLYIPHGYIDTPSFITEWFCPSGNFPGSLVNQTYGIGSLEVIHSGGDSIKIKAFVDQSSFQIIADNGNSPVSFTGTYVEFRYYIFANPLTPPIENI